jgi:hypothetical protein
VEDAVPDKEYRQLEQALKEKDINKATSTMLYLCFNIDDINWLEDRYIALLEHENDDVSGLAATCLGHIARIHGEINQEKVLPVLQEKLKDARLVGRVQDALDDISIFCNKNCKSAK